MSKRRFTLEEDNFIRENYLTMTDEELGSALSRTKDSVKTRRSRYLKLFRERYDTGGHNRHTYEYVKKYIEIESNSGCKLISNEYINNQETLILTCSLCGREFPTTFAQFFSQKKYSCNKCSHEVSHSKQRHSYGYIKAYIEQYKYTLLSNYYENAFGKLDIKDSEGYKYNITFSNFQNAIKNNQKFLKFSVDNPYTVHNIKLYLKLNNKPFELLSEEYLGKNIKLLWKCFEGHEWSALLYNILKGHGCPYCAGQGKPDVDFIYEQFNERGYKLLPFVYENNTTKLNYICSKHKERGIQQIDWAHFSLGNGCYYCGLEKSAKLRTKSTKDFIKEVKNLVGDEYTVLGEYIKGDIHIKMMHNICKNDFMMKPNYFLGGNRCPICNLSIGICKIIGYLKDNNFIYDIEYKFDDCRNKKSLPFDIVVFDKNYNILCLIEYDGEHHFYPVNFSGISDEKAIENFKQTQYNDKIKNEYCKNNNINILRIPYWVVNNIDDILNKYLSKLNNQKIS